METKTKTYIFNTFYNIGEHMDNEIEYYKKNKSEFLHEYFIDYNREVSSVTDKEIETHFREERYDFENNIHWDWFSDDIVTEFEEYIGKNIHVKGSNIGWRNLEGEKTFQLTDGEDIFTEIAPQNCDLSFYISKVKEKEYKITIYHHDSPMGEHYKLTIQ